MVGGTVAALGVGVSAGQLLDLHFTDGLQDSSPEGHAGVASGDVEMAPGPVAFGSAVRFSNPDPGEGITPQFIDYGENPGFRLHGEFSIAMWIQCDAPASRGTEVLISNGPADGTSYGWRVLRRTGPASIEYSLNGGTGTAGGGLDSAVVDDTWRHVAMIRKDGELRFFRQGRFVAATSAGYVTPEDHSHLWIGGVPGQDLGFNGSLDEVLVCDHALTDDEVAALALTLQYRRTAPNQLTFFWSARLPPVSLQTRPLSATEPSEWTTVPGRPTSNQGTWEVSVEPSADAAFYRLKKD